MPFSTTSRRRLGILATACLLGVALPAGGAFAQKVKNKGVPAEQTTTAAPQSTFSVDIPNIDAVGSNVDTATLRAIFSGNIVDNADALAGLSATSISIPTITLDATTIIDGQTRNSQVTFSDLVLSDVSDGVAASVSMAGMSLDAGDDGNAQFGTLAASDFDIGGVLGLYGLVDAGSQTELETIYTDFSFEGGTLESPEIACTMGAVSASEFKARPLGYTFAEIIGLVETLETQGDDPSPETIGSALRMYADILTAFETSGTEFEGFDCAGTDNEGQSVSFSIAGMSMGPMSPGIYPSISLDGLDVSVEQDGTFQVGNITFKEMDLSGPIAAIQAAPAAVDEAWFTANARSLIPAFAGFSFSDVTADVPDPENEGGRIAVGIGAFDLSLGAYRNGIPTDLLTTASNIVIDLPADTENEQFKELIALGVTTFDAGFTVDASWNEAENAIAIDEISVTGADLATIKLAGTIANATEALFGLNENAAMAAAMGVAVSNLKLDVTDAGLSDIILARAAAEQGSDAATMRPVFAGLARARLSACLPGPPKPRRLAPPSTPLSAAPPGTSPSS